LDTGDAGIVYVQAGQLKMDAMGSHHNKISSDTSSMGGNAGSVSVAVNGALGLFNGAEISSSSNGSGNAGTVSVNADSMQVIDNNNSFTGVFSNSIAVSDSSGHAGSTTVTINGLLELKNGAEISSDTSGGGNAGTVKVQAGEIKIDGQNAYSTGISSNSGSYSGNAGNLIVASGSLLKLQNGAAISASTFGSGNAGTIHITAKQLWLDHNNSDFFTGIKSQAGFDASGLVGNIFIDSKEINFLNGSKASIEHQGNLPQSSLSDFQVGSLFIKTNNLNLYENSKISASSSGNAPASAINLEINNLLHSAGSSQIATSANSNNGGNISISGNGAFILRDSLVTTSTEHGNGGNIVIKPQALLMDTGFIQANTTTGAQGGNIDIDVPFLLTRNAISPEIGGITRQKFKAGSNRNIIQAAAPEGNPGTLSLSFPEIDINASISILSDKFMESIKISEDPCSASNRINNNSLVAIGRGGIPYKASDPSAIFFAGKRLDKLLMNNADLLETSYKNKQENISMLKMQSSNNDCINQLSFSLGLK